jgi:tetraacyldisaccharide 4'-kinase
MLEPLYRAVFQYVQKKGATGAARGDPGLPLIVVGNITAGGSGKTPLVIRLCQLAAEMNIRVGIATTGYGRQSKDTRLVRDDSDTHTCGDEPVLLAARTGVPVVVAGRRADAIRKLAEMGLDLVISDDGLQQPDLLRDMELCVVDGERGLGNGHLLPAGPLREPAARLELVDYVITTGIWNGKPANLATFVMRLEAGSLYSLDDNTTITADQFRQKYNGMLVHAVAGIGNPQRFFRTLESLGITAALHVFPDHHLFGRGDFNSIPHGQAIIMTEKDAVKCRTMGLAEAWYLPVDTRLPEAFEIAFKDRLERLLEMRK